MADGSAVSASLVGCFDASKFSAEPFRHWLLSDILPVALCDAIDALPARPANIEDTLGKRETHNSSRLFFGLDNRRRSSGVRRARRRLPSGCDGRAHRAFVRNRAARQEPPAHRILPRHRRLLARAAHRHRRQAVHDAGLPFDRAGQRGVGHRHSRRQSQSRRRRALQAQWRARSSCRAATPGTASTGGRSTACAGR